MLKYFSLIYYFIHKLIFQISSICTPDFPDSKCSTQCGVCASMSLCVFYVGTILRCAVLSLSTLSYMFLFGVFDFCTLTGNVGMGQVQMRASKRQRACEDVDGDACRKGERDGTGFKASLSLAVEGKFDFHSWNVIIKSACSYPSK